MRKEKTLSRKVVYSGRAGKLRVDTIEMPDGRQTTREVVERSDCIAVVPIDADDNVLLVRQYRTAVEKELLEIPAGGIDPGEDPETAVRREMREETGYLPQKLERLGGFYIAPGYSSEYMYLYLVTDLVPSPLHAEDTEGIELVRMPVDKVLGLVTSSKIGDAKSIAGLLTYLEYRKLH